MKKTNNIKGTSLSEKRIMINTLVYKCPRIQYDADSESDRNRLAKICTTFGMSFLIFELYLFF
ncbi:MAG: hypothetical protein ACTSV2_10225, partial [Candidatus Thorarchaeota archaeon]